MLSIVLKELKGNFNSLVAYIVIGVFLLFTGLFTWFFQDSNVLDYGFSDLGSFFRLTPYLFFFLIPALTMRQFSDEFKSGTFELLLTKPLSYWQIVLGKFFATAITILVALVPTFIYYFSIVKLGNPAGNIDSAAVVGSYIGLILLACSFVSIGLFASSVTDNQIVAFVIAAALIFFFYDGLHQFAQLFSGKLLYYLDYFSLSFQFDSLQRGVIDSRNVIYLLSITALFLFLSRIIISKKTK